MTLIQITISRNLTRAINWQLLAPDTASQAIEPLIDHITFTGNVENLVHRILMVSIKLTQTSLRKFASVCSSLSKLNDSNFNHSIREDKRLKFKTVAQKTALGRR